jgi:chromosome segregation ATPase
MDEDRFSGNSGVYDTGDEDKNRPIGESPSGGSENEGRVDQSSKSKSKEETKNRENGVSKQLRKLRSERERLENVVREIEERTNGAAKEEESGQAVEEIERKIEKKIQRLEGKVAELESLVGGLERIQKDLDEDEEAFVRAVENAIKKLLGEGKDGLEEMTESISLPVEKALETIEDDLQEAGERFKNIADQVDRRYKLLGKEAAQMQKVSTELKRKVTEVSETAETMDQFEGKLDDELQRARTAAQTIESASLDDHVQKLKKFSTETVEETVRMGARVQENMLEQIDNRQAEILNELDERIKNVSMTADNAQRMIEQRLGEMQAIHTAIRDMEKSLDEQIKNLVKEARGITPRRAGLIAGSIALTHVITTIVLYILGAFG